MIRRLQQVVSKFIFCYNVTADTGSFFTLLVNTKKYKTNHLLKSDIEKPVQYQFNFNNRHRAIYLRTHSGDIAMLYEIFWQKVYEPAVNKISNPHTIVDLGANIGMTGLFFSQHFPKATIYTVEPNTENYEILTENLSKEIQNGTLVPVKAAITDKDGEAYIQKGIYAYNSMVSEKVVTDNKVRAYNMNTFLYEMMITQVDILKIDIEGMEERIFAQDTDWLEMVNVIVMECHSANIEQLCRLKLAEYGFNITKENHLLFATRK